jgi:Retrotransposon gag protein
MFTGDLDVLYSVPEQEHYEQRSIFMYPTIPAEEHSSALPHALPPPTPSPVAAVDYCDQRATLHRGDQDLFLNDRRCSRRQRDLSPEYLGVPARLTTIVSTTLKPNIIETPTMSLRIKIDRFQSGVDSVDEWLSDFERKSVANGWTDPNKLSCLPCFLSGAPLQWFLDMEATHKRQANPPDLLWATVKASLLSAFAGDVQQGFRNQLRERVQGPNETNEDYVYDVVRLCNKVNPQMDELDRVQQIMSGLLPSVLDKITMLENRTMAELMANVKRAMVSRNLLLNRMCPVGAQRTHTAPATSVTASVSAPSLEGIQNQLEQLSRDMTAQREAVFAVMHEQQEQKQLQRTQQLYPQHTPFLTNQHSAPLQMAPQHYNEVTVAPIYRQQQQPGPRYSNNNHRPAAPDMGRNRNFQRTQDGRPICLLCFRPGHVMLQCPQLDQARNSLANADADGPPQHQGPPQRQAQGNERPQTN